MDAFRLQKMELNDMRFLDLNFAVRRVPGGWIFEYYNKSGEIKTTQFVPYNEEFISTKLNWNESLPKTG